MLKWLIFIAFSGQFLVSLQCLVCCALGNGFNMTSVWQQSMTSAWPQIETLSPLSQTLPSRKISHCGDTPAIIKGLKHLQQPTAVKTFFYHSWKQSREDDIYLTLKLSLSSRREVLPLLQPTVTRQPLNKFGPFETFLICRKNIVFHLYFPFPPVHELWQHSRARLPPE